MKDITEDILMRDDYVLYIDTPFCGTCHVARHILKQIEAAHEHTAFYHMNASLYPSYMQTMQVESVPCLLIKTSGIVEAKVYAFHSVPNMYMHLLKHRPMWFYD